MDELPIRGKAALFASVSCVPIDPGQMAPAAGGGAIYNAASVLCFSSSPNSRFTTTTTMPSTLRSQRAPMLKALSIGIKYEELADRFPQSQLCLPAAHKDPVIMSGLLQGGSSGDWLQYVAVLAQPRGRF